MGASYIDVGELHIRQINKRLQSTTYPRSTYLITWPVQVEQSRLIRALAAFADQDRRPQRRSTRCSRTNARSARR